MTAARDERATARQARRVGRNRLAAAAEDLDRSPAVLRVPGPWITDPAWQAEAQRLDGVRADAIADRSGLLGLEADLDDLDARPPGDAVASQALRVWLDGLASPGELLAGLVPDPRRRFLGAAPAMTEATAAAILRARAEQGGSVGDLDDLTSRAGLTDDDVFDLMHTGRRLADPVPPGQQLGVLLPLRLETRFLGPDDSHAGWRLLVRIFPDAASTDRAPGPPTEAEVALVQRMWQQAAGDLNTPEGSAAFRGLAEQLGGPRAAWLARTLPPRQAGPGTPITVAPPPVIGDPTHPRLHRTAGLPDTLEVWMARGGGAPVRSATLTLDRARIAQDENLEAFSDPDQLDQGTALPETWWLSFAQACQVGLGAVIHFERGADPPTDIDALIVVGLGQDDPADLLAAHRDAGILAVLAPGTPSHTVDGAPAADLRQDPASWLDLARRTGLGQPAARAIAAILAGATDLSPLAGGDLDLQFRTEATVRSLWPALWGRQLKDALGAGLDGWAVGAWAARVLAPEGPAPAIRIDDQAYGVLPATALGRWAPHPTDPPVEAALVDNVRRLREAWADQAEADGNMVAADAARVLDLLARTPSTTLLGWQPVVPVDLISPMMFARGGFIGGPSVDRFWHEEAGPVLGYAPAPARRYLPSDLPVPLDPRLRSGEPRPALKRLLEAGPQQLAFTPDPQWWGREGAGHDDYPVPLLPRLVRHAMNITNAEVGRVLTPPGPWTPEMVLDLANPVALANLASSGLRWGQAPLPAVAHPAWPLLLEAWTSVRQGTEDLLALPAADLDRAMMAAIDTATYRIDPWVTGVAWRRLRWAAARGTPFRLGAYGWVDQPCPASAAPPGTARRPPGPNAAGLLHAPSPSQAAAAAVLRDFAINRAGDRRWDIALDSSAIRVAAELAGQVKVGSHLMEALGREVERIAGDPATVLQLRRSFPMRDEHAGRRVCDGEKVLRAARDNPALLPAGLTPEQLTPLQDAIDTYGDLLVADAVFDIVDGHLPKAAEAMEAGAGLGPPPELRLLRTRRRGTATTTTALAVLPAGPGGATGPAAIADPVVAALVETATGGPAAWTWSVEGPGGPVTVSLAGLGLDPIDAALIPPAVLEAKARQAAGADAAAAVTALGAGERRPSALAVLGLLAGGSFPAEGVAAAAAVPSLTLRLAALRARADQLRTDLSGGVAAAFDELVRWNIAVPAGAAVAADVLAERLTATATAAADVAGLQAQLRTLAGFAALPVVAVAPAPAGLAAVPDQETFDRAWLEVVAAVRPALARLEAWQLGGVGWVAWSTNPAQPWGIGDHVAGYGPPRTLEGGGDVGLVLLDRWAETVPFHSHTTTAAFGFTTPTARAPQAVLVGVAPDLSKPLDTATLVDIVLDVRRLARARMATPDMLSRYQAGLPTSMLLASGPAATDLERLVP